jgi:hypothetical protein
MRWMLRGRRLCIGRRPSGGRRGLSMCGLGRGLGRRRCSPSSIRSSRHCVSLVLLGGVSGSVSAPDKERRDAR